VNGFLIDAVAHRIGCFTAYANAALTDVYLAEIIVRT
jgi:hypothetical protein